MWGNAQAGGVLKQWGNRGRDPRKGNELWIIEPL